MSGQDGLVIVGGVDGERERAGGVCEGVGGGHCVDVRGIEDGVRFQVRIGFSTATQGASIVTVLRMHGLRLGMRLLTHVCRGGLVEAEVTSRIGV